MTYKSYMTITGIMTKIAESGRVVIPADYRKRLGINVGDEVVMFLEGDEIRVISRQIALQRAQQLVRRYTGSRRLSEELIQERREEAENE
jgi:AbrB family looped-hinge helix DNA binding protein